MTPGDWIGVAAFLAIVWGGWSLLEHEKQKTRGTR